MLSKARLWLRGLLSKHSLEQIAAMGNVPSELSTNYVQSRDLLDNVVRECIHVSQEYGGILVPRGRHSYASVLFTSLISRGVSLIILAPNSPWAKKLIEHWDYASAAVIARTMIELRAAFHYLCVDECSDDEWLCRWNLLNLHDCNSRLRLLGAVTEEGKELEKQCEELRDQLRANTHFAQLKNQQKLLNGQTPYLFPIEDMAEKAGLEKKTYRFLHVLFSSHVHGLPMSYYRMDEQERGRGLPSPIEEGYTGLCLSCAATMLAATRDDVRELFKDIAAPNRR